jgi:hypothetical protein
MKVQVKLPGSNVEPVTVEVPPETETIRVMFWYEDDDIIEAYVDALHTINGQAICQHLLSTQIIYERPYFAEVTNEREQPV